MKFICVCVSSISSEKILKLLPYFKKLPQQYENSSFQTTFSLKSQNLESERDNFFYFKNGISTFQRTCDNILVTNGGGNNFDGESELVNYAIEKLYN